MIIFLIFGLIITVIAVVAALQNTDLVTVTFFSGSLTGSIAILLLSSLLIGVIITLLLILPSTLKGYFRYRKLKNEVNKLTEELRKQKELTVFAKNDIKDEAKIITEIEDGAVSINNK